MTTRATMGRTRAYHRPILDLTPPPFLSERGLMCADARRDDMTPEDWHPVGELLGRRTEMAIRACQWCPVQDDCLRWALDEDQRTGIWGGLTPVERGTIRRIRSRVGDQDWIPPEVAHRAMDVRKINNAG